MKTGFNKLRRGFTLLELTIILMMGLMTGTLVLALFNQQLAFLRMYRVQSFITDEAPLINLYLSKMIGKAERYRLHASLEDALAGDNPRTTSSPVCVLNFRQPNGDMRASILSFEDRGQGFGLYYYLVPESGVIGEPQLVITDQAANVEFFMEQGILRTRLTGPEAEQLTYSGAMQ